MPELDLSEAVEAGQKSWESLPPRTGTRLRDFEAIEAAVRAAAPIIERAALLAAAAWFREEINLQSSWVWHQLGETNMEKVAERLELMAKRTDPLTSIGRTGASETGGEADDH